MLDLYSAMESEDTEALDVAKLRRLFLACL